MRISTSQIFNIAMRSMADANKSIIKTQEQLSTGKRVLTPADDPVAATKILALNDEKASIGQYKRNIAIAQNNLSLEESILKSVNGSIQRIQELTVAAGNTATLSDREYRSMAVEVEQRLDELMNLLNTKNSSGDYIFGGYASASEPFSGNSTEGFSYNGNSGQQRIQVSAATSVAATDSGKKLFMDIQSHASSVQTMASPTNRSVPPATINIGLVSDQLAFNEFYPENMVIAFNADSDVTPSGKNFTVTERATGRVIVANVPYNAGEEIEVHGVTFRISGSPNSGTASQAANRGFGSGAAPDFTAAAFSTAPSTFTVRVGNHSETLTLDADLTSVNDLAATLNSTVNGNAQKLARLGISVDNQGFHMPKGVNFVVGNGSAAIDAAMGFDTRSGVATTDGARAESGDRFFIESTNKQDLLTTVSRFKEVMANFDDSPEDRKLMTETVNSTLANLGHSQTSILEVVSQIGARVNTLESTLDLHLDTEFVTDEILSSLHDVDWVEATTRLSSQSLILQAAQQSFIRVSQLSLFSML